MCIKKKGVQRSCDSNVKSDHRSVGSANEIQDVGACHEEFQDELIYSIAQLNADVWRPGFHHGFDAV